MAESNQPSSVISPPSDDALSEPVAPAADRAGGVASGVEEAEPGTMVYFGDQQAVTPVQMTIGGAVVLVAAVVFLLARSNIVSYFASKRADPGAASRAGWSFYWLMLMLTVVLTAGYLFSLLTLPLFYVSAGIVVAIFFTMFVMSLVAARRSVR